MKKLTRTIAVQPVRVFFISSVIVIGKPIRFTPVREQSLFAKVEVAHPPRRVGWTRRILLLRSKAEAIAATRYGVASHNFG